MRRPFSCEATKVILRTSSVVSLGCNNSSAMKVQGDAPDTERCVRLSHSISQRNGLVSNMNCTSSRSMRFLPRLMLGLVDELADTKSLGVNSCATMLRS